MALSCSSSARLKALLGRRMRGGATPFDSGGWWLGKIQTDPTLDEAARQVAFPGLDVPLGDWQEAFEEYLHSHYGRVSDYLMRLS